MVSQGHIQFKGKSDVIDSPPGCLLRQQTAFHKLINIWLTAKHVRRLVRCAHTRRKTSTFKCGAKMVDFTGCTGTSPGEPSRWPLPVGKYQRIVHSAHVEWAPSVCQALSHWKTPCGFYGSIIKAVVQSIQINVKLELQVVARATRERGSMFPDST